MTVAIFTSDDLVIEPLSVNEWLESDQWCGVNRMAMDFGARAIGLNGMAMV